MGLILELCCTHPPQYLIKDLAVWVRTPALVTHCVSLGKARL